jgi:hypothetical protein
MDGGATACISNNVSDFLKPPQASKVRVKGFKGSTSTTQVDTVSWIVLDDTGHSCTLVIPNTYCVPACPLWLLSPQHFSQETCDLRGTYSTNYGDHVLFVWDQGRYRATLLLSSSTNVGILWSAPGHKVFSNFVGVCSTPALFAPAVVSDDEANLLDTSDDDHNTLSGGDNNTLSGDTTRLEGVDEGSYSNPGDTPESPLYTENDRPAVIPFDLDHDDPLSNLPTTDDTTSSLDAPSKLMRWHCRLGHLPFAKIRLMAAQREIPKRLHLKTDLSHYALFLYDYAHNCTELYLIIYSLNLCHTFYLLLVAHSTTNLRNTF